MSLFSVELILVSLTSVLQLIWRFLLLLYHLRILYSFPRQLSILSFSSGSVCSSIWISDNPTELFSTSLNLSVKSVLGLCQICKVFLVWDRFCSFFLFSPTLDCHFRTTKSSVSRNNVSSCPCRALPGLWYCWYKLAGEPRFI